MVVAYFDAEGTDFYGIFEDYLELRGEMDWDGVEEVYAGEAHYPEPYVNADLIIDNIIDDFECNHDMEFLTDVLDENYNKLEKMINDTVIRWIDECGYKPSGVELDEELHKVLV